MSAVRRAHTLLVIDDSPIVLRATVDRLSRAGFAVDGEESPGAALDRLVHAAPDLALLDATMPGPGDELLVMAARRCYRRHQIVLHSGLCIDELQEWVERFGVLGSIQKTGDDHKLVNALQAYLALSHERVAASRSILPASQAACSI